MEKIFCNSLLLNPIFSKKSNSVIIRTMSIILRNNPFIFKTNPVIFRINALILKTTWDRNLDFNQQKLTETNKNRQKLKEMDRNRQNGQFSQV